ncbi:hypothetical protein YASMINEVIRUS_998 [Yasminevirus sp. GU-2018]|uniref:Uncharacterized protein n=1 Tax=Yasminevirus sp. GU-2018 TaxID=2420051 RepID=A0A5K0U9V7_9VIRU|nr:hypothetical protein YASMINEVIRUS_998 [Yasminevirus sp. GU-2018]
MSFSSYKQRMARPVVMKPIQQELDRVPRQFSDFMNEQSNRFSEICKVYLEGMTVDDVRYMKPEDFINLVPVEHHRHKLLMTIMVRRYLYRPDESEAVYCKPEKCDTFTDSDSTDTPCDKNEYACDKCSHVCSNSNCNHNCGDYTKIVKGKN